MVRASCGFTLHEMVFGGGAETWVDTGTCHKESISKSFHLLHRVTLVTCRCSHGPATGALGPRASGELLGVSHATPALGGPQEPVSHAVAVTNP